MTRLRSEDVELISPNMEQYNNNLIAKTGYSLNQIAAYAAGVDERELYRNKLKAAVVPITSGKGVIKGFSQAVAGIVNFMGLETIVTEKTDVGGVAEAITKAVDVILMADDHRFVAFNLGTRKVADNSDSTGRGFAAVLDLVANGIKDKNILLLGAGPVGRSAAHALGSYGAILTIYDINNAVSQELADEINKKFSKRAFTATDFDSAVKNHRFIYDATPARGIITNCHIGTDTYVAAPGMPLGVSDDAMMLVSDRVIHDPLQIGVATMIFDVIGK